MKRGEIYYITRRDTIGAEIKKTRPAVIVSNDKLNHTSDVIEVVYLTCQPKTSSCTHVQINATGKPSTALCEQIDTVSAYLVGRYCGTCTAEEMEGIDAALLASLGLDGATILEATEDTTDDLELELERLQDERDRYAKMLDSLLGEV